MERTGGRTKQRMLDGAVALLRERGAAAVTVDAVLARSGAPRGSVYHHFPGGRDELVRGAIERAGEHVSSELRAAVQHGDPASALEHFVESWKRSLLDTDYLAGCPVAAVAVDAQPAPPEATTLARTVFDRWHAQLEDLLTAHGTPAPRAARLATLTVAAVEGALLLCRTRRDTAPLDEVRAELAPLLAPRSPAS
ncbi:TetR family transcriptional regulator [Haloactinospora alba]|uniref:TetR family transcriptional regulator n=1 Tax=Haloactinospora alba TaxID=405555 RepID=A0A543NEN8_9ACTN|nr:TetR/AcrR family transcriptional regulator [Haloactinospora alba]TQN30210.1 TetR family transcriptional regulator [Haloactinospora alba]